MTMNLRCLECGEGDQIDITHIANGLVGIRCRVCRVISFLQRVHPCAACGTPLPDHQAGCPMAAEQQLWGV